MILAWNKIKASIQEDVFGCKDVFKYFVLNWGEFTIVFLSQSRSDRSLDYCLNLSCLNVVMFSQWLGSNHKEEKEDFYLLY